MRRPSVLIKSLATAVLLALVAIVPAAHASSISDTLDAASTEVGPNSHGYCNNYRSFSRNAGLIRVPSIGTSGSTHCIMNRGAQSRGVLELQRSIEGCYALSTGPDGPDGIYGAYTEQAVRWVQQIHRIEEDGVYGPQTRNHMSFYPACVGWR